MDWVTNCASAATRKFRRCGELDQVGELAQRGEGGHQSSRIDRGLDHCNQNKSLDRSRRFHQNGVGPRPREAPGRDMRRSASGRSTREEKRHMPDKEHTRSVSESENPVIPSPTPKRGRPRTNKDWWPNQLDLSVLHHHSHLSNPMEEDFDYAETVQVPRRRGAEAGPRRADDEVAGLVAGRLRPLRPALHPHDVACRRHVPHRRRPRRRRRRPAALRSPQQLARQREPRQGAPAALAAQEEVRPEDLLGRPAGPGRQRGHGLDGVQDVRLRLRPARRLGARGHLLGSRGHLAGRRSATAATATSPSRSAPCRWASST